MASKSLTRRPGILLLILVFFTLIALSIQVKRGQRTLLGSLTLTVMSPLLSSVQGAFNLTQRGVNAYLWQRDAALEADRLKLERIDLLARIKEMEKGVAENRRLRALLKVPPSPEHRFVAAQAFTQFGAPFKSYLLISVKDTHPVPEDTPVIGPKGVIGRVTVRTGSLYKVLLITDPASAVGVSSRRTGVNGVAEGDGALMRVKWVSAEADVKARDIFETSGQDGVFPAGFPVCTVTSVDTKKNYTLKIEAAPVAELDKLDWVLLVEEKNG